jgi:hypothetical protein
MFGILFSSQTSNPIGQDPPLFTFRSMQTNLARSMTTIDTIQQLCSLFFNRSLTTVAISDRLGKVLNDRGSDLPVDVQPADPVWQAARIIRQVGTDKPAHVDLTLANPTSLSVKDLASAFGAYSELPLRSLDLPPRILFDVDSPDSSESCVVIASVKPGSRGIENGSITAVTIRHR